MSTSSPTASVFCREHRSIYLQTSPLLLSSRPVASTLTWYFQVEVSKANQPAPNPDPLSSPPSATWGPLSVFPIFADGTTLHLVTQARNLRGIFGSSLSCTSYLQFIAKEYFFSLLKVSQIHLLLLISMRSRTTHECHICVLSRQQSAWHIVGTQSKFVERMPFS